MTVSHEQLTGLDRDRLLAVVEPILKAHRVEGVELLWKADRAGRVLALTVERAGATAPGEGVTLELCSEISRDLSSALDVADVINQRYRLEVGSPGVERTLYRADDYRRFAGRSVKLKLGPPDGGVVEGRLEGMTDRGAVRVETNGGPVELGLERIEASRLVFDWNGRGQGARRAGPGRNKSGKKGRVRRSKG